MWWSPEKDAGTKNAGQSGQGRRGTRAVPAHYTYLTRWSWRIRGEAQQTKQEMMRVLHWVPGLGSLAGFGRSRFKKKCVKIHDVYFRDVETPFSRTLR
jgi:hypothetical protein